MHLILFDDHSWENLLPLTFTRPVSSLRVGILTIAEKWEHDLGMSASPLTRNYLQGKYPALSGEENLMVNGSLLPESNLVDAILDLKAGEALAWHGTLLALKTGEEGSRAFNPDQWLPKGRLYPGELSLVDYPWKIFELNGQEIEADFARITSGRQSEPLCETVWVIHPERVFVEPGFRGEYITLNASAGPIYLGNESEIMEGSVIRGPFALCEGSTVKLGAKIYGPTTLGPFSKVGGEVTNTVFHANSNKAHDGYLGNAVIGEWCNLGADTNSSNLKNNYAEVSIWNYPAKGLIKTGRQFCGLIMGDHSKCGINTMFNTGTVVGVSANVFGAGFNPNFIPSFSWGGPAGFTTYRLDKALDTINRMMERKEEKLSEPDASILETIFRNTEEFRR